MELILFIGIQASGKSTFYKERFLNTHLRISNDLLKTKNRVKKLIDFCIETDMNAVIDNTNISVEVRKTYIERFKASGYQITGYYFKTDLGRAVKWNDRRKGKENIPMPGILGTHKKLELPSFEEGFDRLYYVDFEDGQAVVKEWNNEI